MLSNEEAAASELRTELDRANEREEYMQLQEREQMTLQTELISQAVVSECRIEVEHANEKAEAALSEREIIEADLALSQQREHSTLAAGVASECAGVARCTRDLVRLMSRFPNSKQVPGEDSRGPGTRCKTRSAANSRVKCARS